MSKMVVMGVEAILTPTEEGGVKVALPAFCLGKKDKVGIYYWAGELREGRIVSLHAEPARDYLEQIVLSLPPSKP